MSIQVEELGAKVDVVVTIDGQCIPTAVSAPTVTALRELSKTDRAEIAIANAQTFLASTEAPEDVQIGWSAELFAQLEALYANDEEARQGEQARPGSNRWQELATRGLIAQKAAVRRLQVLGNEQAAPLLLGFLVETWTGEYPQPEPEASLQDIVGLWAQLIGA